MLAGQPCRQMMQADRIKASLVSAFLLLGLFIRALVSYACLGDFQGPRPIFEAKSARAMANQFAILFDERFFALGLVPEQKEQKP